MAPGSVRPRSNRSSNSCSTVVMIVAPPGDPSASRGLPSCNTIVGAMLERGRLPPAGELAVPATKLKSVSSLLSKNPLPGTTMALPPICSMVNV